MTTMKPHEENGEPASLTESDISSERVSRRSLLATLGLGAAAAAIVGAVPAPADELSSGPTARIAAADVYLKVPTIDGDVTEAKKGGKKRLKANQQSGTRAKKGGRRR